MTRSIVYLLISLNATGPGLTGEPIKLPPEVTPVLRAACEVDARRLCIQPASTVQSVRRCMLSNFDQLATQCQREIKAAGLGP